MVSPIIWGAIGGGAGGAIGALAGHAIDKWRQNKNADAKPWVGLIALAIAIPSGRALPAMMKPTVEMELTASSPLFRTLQAYYPVEFQKIADYAKAHPNDAQGLRALSEATMGDLTAANLPKFDDENAGAFYSVIIRQVKALGAKDPRGCVRFFATGKGGPEMVEALPASERQSLEGTFANALRQAATKPAAPAQPMSEEESADLIKPVFAELTAEEQKLALPVVSGEKAPTTDPEADAACKLYVGFTEHAMSGPKGILRKLAATK